MSAATLSPRARYAVLFAAISGAYSRVSSLCGLIYALGLVVIWWAPDTSKKNLQE